MTSKRFQVYFFLGLFAISLAVSYFVFRPYLALIVFAGVLAVLVQPLYRWLLKAFRGHRSVAAWLTVLVTLLLVLLPLAFLAASLAVEAVDVFHRVQAHLQFEDLETTLGRVLSPDQAHLVADQARLAVAGIADNVQPFFTALSANVYAIFSNTVAVIFDVFIIAVGLYYLLKDGPALKRELMDLSPLADADDAAIFDRIRDAIQAVAYGSFIVSLIKGVTGGALFYFLGLPAPVFWGTMIALSSLIPVIGSGLVIAPFAAWLFFTGHFWSGLILTVASVLLIGLVDNALGPQLIRHRQKTNIHPMLILLSLLGGLSFFGALGVFFGPIALTVTLALLDIYKKEFRKELETAR